MATEQNNINITTNHNFNVYGPVYPNHEPALNENIELKTIYSEKQAREDTDFYF